MPLPEGTRLREGDILVLHGRVRFDDNDDNDKHVFVTIGEIKVTLLREKVVGIARLKFEVGEVVCLKNESAAHLRSDNRATVLGIADEHVWVKWPSGALTTEHASDLGLAPELFTEEQT